MNLIFPFVLFHKEKDMKKMKVLLAIAVMVAAGKVAEAQQADDQQPDRDRLRAAVQEICPVSGQKLGAHGAPVKVKIGEEQLFLCCKGCMQGEISPEHWATIHANFAKAQGICPVMKNALPEKAKWTIVEGRIVYVCCPPCTKKIEADPATYLEKVDELYAASLEKREEQQ